MAHHRKKKRTVKKDNSIEENSKTPKNFVIRTGKVGKSVSQLVKDVRKVMEPNTAARLKERKSNTLRDYLAMSGPLGVTHMMVFRQSDTGINMRLIRTPRGPTFTFRVNTFTLTKDLVHDRPSMKIPGTIEFLSAPLLVLNNFSTFQAEPQGKLAVSMLQNMFPSLNISKMNVKETRRVVLFHYNEEKKRIDFRHYLIHMKMTGVSKSIKKILTGSSLPDLSAYKDISEFVLEDDYASEVSDQEDVVQLAQNYVGRGNQRSAKRAIVLTEIGPRMELELIKIENGFSGGEVIYHSFVEKTPEQVMELKNKAEKKKQEKLKRKKEQERNVKRKKDEKKNEKKKNGKEEEIEEDQDEEEFEEEEFSDLNEDVFSEDEQNFDDEEENHNADEEKNSDNEISENSDNELSEIEQENDDKKEKIIMK